MPEPQGDCIEAAKRGADVERPLDGEPTLTSSTSREADFWIDAYRQLVALEEQLETTIRNTMSRIGESARLEVETTNLPLIESQMERFRKRLSMWERRRRTLDSQSSSSGP